MQPPQNPQGGIQSRPWSGYQQTSETTASEQSSDAMDCPECGVHLVNLDHRRKHAIGHYGTAPIPRYPQHDQAAERKALLMGVDPAAVRG